MYQSPWQRSGRFVNVSFIFVHLVQSSCICNMKIHILDNCSQSIYVEEVSVFPLVWNCFSSRISHLYLFYDQDVNSFGVSMIHCIIVLYTIHYVEEAEKWLPKRADAAVHEYGTWIQNKSNMIGLFDQMNRFLMGRKDIYRSHHQTDIVRVNLNLEVEFSWRWFGQLWNIW